jgi:TolB-like protein
LGIGIASEIINELAHDRDLKVIGRDSSFALGSQAARAQELGVQLGARYLVKGTAQRSKNTLVVDVQLVDARDGIIAWGDRFSATATDIPHVQRSIATKIAASLRVNIRETEKQAILGRAPRDLGVYEPTLAALASIGSIQKQRGLPEKTWKKRSIRILTTPLHGPISVGSTLSIFGCNLPVSGTSRASMMWLLSFVVRSNSILSSRKPAEVLVRQ